MLSKQYVVEKLHQKLNEMPTPYKHAYLRKFGFEFDTDVPSAVKNIMKLYDSTWGTGGSTNEDIRFGQAYKEAHGIGLQAVMRFQSDG
ncbi:MAG: hypothetical protein FWF98_05630 [Dehalococcoidia bacterium]|nr:hypothetical protein [Dehalococcoidia bacterium]